jgi:uncharacterized protein (DUF433 family)
MPEVTKSLYRECNPVDVALYSLIDASRYLRVSSQQLRLLGQRDPAISPLKSTLQNGHSGHLPNKEMISFRELVDLFLRCGMEADIVDQQLYRSRLEFEDALPIRLFPFSRTKIDVHSPRIIAIDPRYSFGNPIIANRHIRTDVVAGRFRAGESVSELASDLEIPIEEVEEAVRYESGYWDY